MLDAGDPLRGHAVHLPEDADGEFAHDDEALGESREPQHDEPLLVVGLPQHRVERHHERFAEPRGEREDVVAGGPPEDPELVLDDGDVDLGAVERLGRADVVAAVVLADGPRDERGVVVGGVVVVDGDHLGAVRSPAPVGGLRDPLGEVRGEGGDPAAARGEVSDECDVQGG